MQTGVLTKLKKTITPVRLVADELQQGYIRRLPISSMWAGSAEAGSYINEKASRSPVPILDLDRGIAGDKLHEKPWIPCQARNDRKRVFSGEKINIGQLSTVAIRFYFAVFILALFMVPVEALADIIVLSNGDRITGKVLEFSGGRLKFHTEYAGELRIDWGDIRSVETEDPFFVQVKEGPVIRARIRMAKEEMWLEDEEGVSHPVAQENILGFYSHSPKSWTIQYDLGYQQAKGNATISDLRTSLKLKMKKQRDDLLLATSYARGKTDGEVSADRWDIQSKYNRLLNRKLYGTTIFLLERDRLRDIDRRWQVGPGIGYRFYDTGILFLSTDIGTVWEKTRYEPAGSESKLKGFWGLDFFYVFWSGIKVEETFRWIQGSTEGSDYEINSETGLNVPIDENLFLKASLVNRYDNKPQPGLKRYDRSFITSLSYITRF